MIARRGNDAKPAMRNEVNAFTVLLDPLPCLILKSMGDGLGMDWWRWSSFCQIFLSLHVMMRFGSVSCIWILQLI
jgi:hypothetical protein